MALFDRSHMSFYLSSIVTMDVACTVFEIKQDIGRKMPSFHTSLVFNLHDPLEHLQIFVQNFNTICLNLCKLLPKSSSLCLGCNNITVRRQTDGL